MSDLDKIKQIEQQFGIQFTPSKNLQSINPGQFFFEHNNLIGLSLPKILCNEVPILIQDFNSLRYLSFTSKKFPSWIESLNKIETLCICAVQEYPQELIHLPNLKRLSVSLNYPFGCPLPPWLGKFDSIIELYLEFPDEKIRPILDQIGTLINLEFLSIVGSFKLHENIRDLKKLTRLFLEGKFELPSEFGDLINLIELKIHNSEFLLPESIGNLIQLQFIEITNTNLKIIPDSIGLLKNLLEFWGDNNKLRYIPNSIGFCKKIRSFSAENNEISSIPSEFGQLKNLERLYLSKNNISHIPDSICNCLMLEILDLGENPLMKLPENIGLLPHLRELNIPKTQISSLPTSLDLPSWVKIWATDCPLDERSKHRANETKAKM